MSRIQGKVGAKMLDECATPGCDKTPQWYSILDESVFCTICAEPIGSYVRSLPEPHRLDNKNMPLYWYKEALLYWYHKANINRKEVQRLKKVIMKLQGLSNEQ